MATAPIRGMTVAAAIEILPGGRSEAGTRQVRAGMPGKVQSTPWTGPNSSSYPTVSTESFRSSWQSVLATMDAGGDRAIEEEAGTDDAGAENPALLEVPTWKAPGTASTAGVQTTAASPATSTQWTHSTISQQGSTSISSGARIPASKPATSLVSQGTMEHDAKSVTKARLGESLHGARSLRTETGAQTEHPAAALRPESTPVSTGVASLALPTPILARQEAPAQPPDDSGIASPATPIPFFAETDAPAQQPGASGIASPSTPYPSDAESVASFDFPAVSPMGGPQTDSAASVAPVQVPAADSWVPAPTALSPHPLSFPAPVVSESGSISRFQSSPSSVRANSSQSSIQSPPLASSNSETGAYLHESVANQALKQVPVQTPVQTPKQDNPPSQIPNQARTETDEVQPSSRSGVSNQFSNSQPDTAQSHTMRPALPGPASVVPATANSNPVSSSATSDPLRPAPIPAGETGTRAIEPKLPVAKPGSAGNPQTSAEASSRPTHWANGVEGVSQASSLHPAQPGAPAQDGPVVAPVRDPAGFGGAANAGSQWPASVTNSGGSAGDAFATIDAGMTSGLHTWVHAGTQRAEAGFQDPDLGWIGVRADTSGGGIHAALIPGSADASQALGGHLAGLNAYLADHHTPVDTLTLAEFDSRSSGSGTDRQGSETMHQGAEQKDGRGAYSEAQPNSGTSTPAIAATASSQTSLPAAGQDSTYDTQRPGGAHISVIA